MALVASPTPAAQDAAKELRQLYEWHPIEKANLIVALGGDGFMLRTLHAMLDRHRILPVFGMNLGTVGFLMNDWKLELLELRLQHAKSITVQPLRMDAVTVDGERISYPAINEVSLLRETRETAKIEITIDGRTVLPELVCDGVLVATPAGSTAYNLSAQGADPAARIVAAGADADQPVPPAALARGDPAEQDRNLISRAGRRKTAGQRGRRPARSARCPGDIGVGRSHQPADAFVRPGTHAGRPDHDGAIRGLKFCCRQGCQFQEAAAIGRASPSGKEVFPGSSAVERSTVNRMVACSNQARGAIPNHYKATSFSRRLRFVRNAILTGVLTKSFRSGFSANPI